MIIPIDNDFRKKCEKIKAYYKKELTAMNNLSAKAFASWTPTYIPDLEKHGYKKAKHTDAKIKI